MGKNVIISTLPNISQNYLPKVNTSNIFANSLVYDDGNSVLINTTTASAFRLDVNGTARTGALTLTGALSGTSATFSSNIGLGVTPSSTTLNTIQSDYGILSGNLAVNIASNAYFNSGWKYYGTGWATLYNTDVSTGKHDFYVSSASGTAGNAISWGTAKLSISSTGAATFSSSVTAGGLSRIGDVYIGGRSGTYASYTDGLFGDNIHLGATGLGGAVYINTALSRNTYINPVGGNVGIGTTSPTARLHLKAPSNDIVLRFEQQNDITSQYYFNIDSTINGALSLITNYLGGNVVGFSQNRSGNVGIGTASPGSYGSARLVVLNSAAAELARFTDGTNADIVLNTPSAGLATIDVEYGTAGALAIRTGTGKNERMRITSGGDIKSYTNYIVSKNGSDTIGAGPFLSLQTASGTNYQQNIQLSASGHLDFWNYDSSSWNMRMRITSGGVVLVGTTSTTGLATGSSANPGVSIGPGASSFQVNNNSNIYLSKASGFTSGDFTAHFVNGTYVGGISTNGSSTTYATASDYRLKTDLKDFIGIDIVNLLNVYDYQWISNKSRSFGVLAHELQSVLPDAVTGIKDGEQMQGVDYSKLTPILVKAIQEQQAQIEEQKADIESLKALINK